MVSKARFLKSDEEHEVRGYAVATELFPSALDMVIPGLNYPNIYADIRMIPDKNSYRPCPWNSKAGMVFVKFENFDGSSFELCSRSLLKKACQDLK